MQSDFQHTKITSPSLDHIESFVSTNPTAIATAASSHPKSVISAVVFGSYTDDHTATDNNTQLDSDVDYTHMAKQVVAVVVVVDA